MPARLNQLGHLRLPNARTVRQTLYRRAPTAEKQARLGAVVEATATQGGATLEDGLKAGVAYMLSSPKFLHTTPTAPGPARAALGTEILESLALVLWNSVPNSELIDRAEAGELDTPAGLAGVVDEMLVHPNSSRFARRMAEQWLTLNGLNEDKVDAVALGLTSQEWSNLLPLFVEETTRFLQEAFDTDAPIARLLTADFSMLNQQLADFYELGVQVDDWQRVDFPIDSPRRGLLSQGSVLVSGSSGTHASIVRRGVTVLGHLICQPPPDPPPTIFDQAVAQGSDLALTEQQKMASRADSALCQGCHVDLDSIGFAYFEFDALGRHRTDLDGAPLDTSVTFRGNSYPVPKSLRPRSLNLD